MASSPAEKRRRLERRALYLETIENPKGLQLAEASALRWALDELDKLSNSDNLPPDGELEACRAELRKANAKVRDLLSFVKGIAIQETGDLSENFHDVTEARRLLRDLEVRWRAEG